MHNYKLLASFFYLEVMQHNEKQKKHASVTYSLSILA